MRGLPDPHRTTLFHEQILAKPALNGVGHSFIDTGLTLEIYEQLKARAGGRPTIPSLGYLAMRYFLQPAERAGRRRALVGFTFRGWRGHDWALEEKIVEELLQTEKMSWL